MQSYLVLGTLTQEGYDNMEQGPATVEQFVDRVDAMGGAFDGNDFYVLGGDYDWAAFIQLPSQEAAAQLGHIYARTGRGRMHFLPIAAQGPGGYEEHVSAITS